MHPADGAIAPKVGTGYLPLAQPVAQGFNRYIEADPAAIFETIDNGFGGVVDRYSNPFDFNRHAPGREGVA